MFKKRKFEFRPQTFNLIQSLNMVKSVYIHMIVNMLICKREGFINIKNENIWTWSTGMLSDSKLRLGTFWFRCNGNIPISNSQTPSGTPPSIDSGISPLLSLFILFCQEIITHSPLHQSLTQTNACMLWNRR